MRWGEAGIGVTGIGVQTLGHKPSAKHHLKGVHGPASGGTP